jgi:hypothetical protein
VSIPSNRDQAVPGFDLRVCSVHIEDRHMVALVSVDRPLDETWDLRISLKPFGKLGVVAVNAGTVSAASGGGVPHVLFSCLVGRPHAAPQPCKDYSEPCAPCLLNKHGKIRMMYDCEFDIFNAKPVEFSVDVYA